MSGPVARALNGGKLAPLVRTGLQAMGDHSGRVDGSLRSSFLDSLDLDSATKDDHPTDHRWDYLLGHAQTSTVVAVEVHSAETSQVSVVIAKKERSREHLRRHLAEGASVAAWYWVASNGVDLVPFDKMKLRLEQNGIQMVGRSLKAKHLESLKPAQSRPRPARQRR
jgi:hypothetical protein